MFKSGENVRCILSIPSKDVWCGRIYRVKNIYGEWMNLTHTPLPYHMSFFEKVNEMNTDKLKEPTIINGKAKPKGKPVANTYYVRKVGGGSPKVVHMTFEAARNEANRLAELTPDAEFQVLAVAYTVKKVPVYTTESTEYSV
jgi:hypothetical protein